MTLLPLAAGALFAVLIMVVLVAGYVVLALIWVLFFRGRGGDEDRRPPGDPPR